MEISELEAFTNVDFGNGYFFSVRKIGDSIIYSSSKGNMKHSDVLRHYQMIEKFIDHAGVKKPYVEIRDYINLTGKPNTSQKDLQKKYLFEHKHDFAGVIVCNIPDWLRILLRITPYLFNIPSEIVICKDYPQAVRKAIHILNKKYEVKDKKLVFEDILFKSDWSFEEKKFKLKNGVIPGKLFFTAFEGIVRFEIAEKVSICMNRLFEEGHLTNSEYIRVADYSMLSNVPLNVRNVYAETLNSLNKKYDSKPVKTYICGASSFIRIAMKLYTALVKQKFIFVESVEEAFTDINSHAEHVVNKEEIITVRQRDIDEIINLSGALVWSGTKKTQISISKDNPLNQLASTLSLIQEDLIDLRKREIEHTRELQKSLDNSEELMRELRESNEESLQLNEELASINEQLHRQKEELETARNQLLGMNTNLETLVENRTKKWKKTVGKLNKTVARLDRFVYSASHDLSAPLKSMLGLVNILKLDPEKTHTTKYLENIESSIHKLEDVIKSLIAYSRNSKLEVKKESFNLFDLVHDVIGDLAPFPRADAVRFIVEVHESQMTVTDKQRMATILYNLIGNSVKYADHDKPDPGVVIRFESDDKKQKIYIIDNGLGIEKHQLKRIFTMFYRGTERSKGSGLGLFIVDETVTALGGKIKVKSEPGKGTEFKVSLPK